MEINAISDSQTVGRQAREQFIRAFCVAWPTIYASQIPCTTDGRVLFMMRDRLLQMMADDSVTIAAMAASPWIRVGPHAIMADFSAATPAQLEELALPSLRLIGMPGLVKGGRMPNGRPWREHHEVKAAEAVAFRTAEYAGDFITKELERRAGIARDRLRAAVKAEKPAKEIAKLESRAKDLDRAVKEAETKLQQLRNDPAEGCRIITHAEDKASYHVDLLKVIADEWGEEPA